MSVWNSQTYSDLHKWNSVLLQCIQVDCFSFHLDTFVLGLPTARRVTLTLSTILTQT